MALARNRPKRSGAASFPIIHRETSSKSSDANAAVAVQTMRDRFQQSKSDQAAVWESLWKDQTTPWDLGEPTRVLQDEMDTFYRAQLLGDDDESTFRHKKQCALIPGCGSGYDLATVASFYDSLVAAGFLDEACVIGLDLSATSLDVAQHVMEMNPCPVQSSTAITLVQGDFFDSSGWEPVASYGGGSATIPTRFDFIFDYTFLCALPPMLRPAWGQTMSNLLIPDTGRLLTLMFPVVQHHAEEPDKGPPYAVTVDDYRSVLEPHGLVAHSSCPRQSPWTVTQRIGQEQVCWWSYAAT